MKCKLCGSEKVDIINTEIRNIYSDKIKVYKCNNCGVHFLYPYYDESKLENYYNGQYREEYNKKNYYYKEQMDKFFEESLPEAKERVSRINKYLKKDDKVLEIGCASGYFLYSIKDKVGEVYGNEWDQKSLEYCKSIGIKTSKNIDDFNKKFNKIFMFQVLEHIKDPLNFINHIKEYLYNDGILFIEIPNNEDILLSVYDIPEFRNFYYRSAHIWYFNEKSLSILLDKAGYKYSIYQIQKYDISNHIYWLKNKVPGGSGYFSNIFSNDLNEEYKNCLIRKGKADTLFAVCYKN